MHDTHFVDKHGWLGGGRMVVSLVVREGGRGSLRKSPSRNEHGGEGEGGGGEFHGCLKVV